MTSLAVIPQPNNPISEVSYFDVTLEVPNNDDQTKQ